MNVWLKHMLGGKKDFVGTAVALIVGVAVWNLGELPGCMNGAQILASLSAMIILLIFEVFPMGITALLWVAFVSATGLVPGELALEGFKNEALWLMVGAFLLGSASVKTGLAKRLTYKILQRAGNSYLKLTLLLYLTGLLLGALVPAGTSRVAIILPVYIGLLEILGAKPNSNTSVNLLMNAKWAFTSGAPSIAWLTASSVNMVALGVLQEHGYEIGWLQWVMLNLPPSLLLGLGLWGLSHLTCPADVKSIAGGKNKIDEELRLMGRMSRDEKLVGLTLLLAILLWMTGPLHGIAPPWVAIMVAGILFFPKLNVLTKKEFLGISWDMLVFFGSVLSIGAVLAYAELDRYITSGILQSLTGPMHGLGAWGGYLLVIALALAVHFIVPSETAGMAVLAPLVIPYSMQNGWNPVLMMLVAVMAMRPWIFPYQSTATLVLWPYSGARVVKVAYHQVFQSLVFIVWIVLCIPWWNFLLLSWS